MRVSKPAIRTPAKKSLSTRRETQQKLLNQPVVAWQQDSILVRDTVRRHEKSVPTGLIQLFWVFLARIAAQFHHGFYSILCRFRRGDELFSKRDDPSYLRGTGYGNRVSFGFTYPRPSIRSP